MTPVALEGWDWGYLTPAVEAEFDGLPPEARGGFVDLQERVLEGKAAAGNPKLLRGTEPSLWELKADSQSGTWRVFYAKVKKHRHFVVLGVHFKKTQKLPLQVRRRMEKRAKSALHKWSPPK